MRDFGSEFGELLQQQKELIRHYEEVIGDYQKSEINLQNVKLKKEVEELQSRLEELKKNYLASEKEVKQLKGHLTEQMLSEKSQLIASSKEKMKIYFGRAEGEIVDKLTQMEQRYAMEIQKLSHEYAKKLGPDYKAFEEKLRGLQYDMHQKVMERTGELSLRKAQLREDRDKRLGEFQETAVTEEMIAKRLRQNSIEVKIGLNWISKAGVLLILIGVIAAMKYSYTSFSASMKGIFGLLIGLGFLGVGEYFNQKKKSVLGTALSGGGIGVCYLTIFWSYFALGIIGMETALVLSILLSLSAFVLSIRYNSRTIGAFALIGGYLPLLSYIGMNELKGEAIYIGMGYVFALNLVTILIAMKKDWMVLKVLSFLSHLPILLYLTFNAPSGIAAVTYTLIVFSMYLVMIFAYPIGYKQKLGTGNIIFLGANTFLSCVVSYGLFNHFGFDAYRGSLALAFCIVYLGLNTLVNRSIKTEPQAAVIFGITSLTFAVLVIPFQFGSDWVVLGWFIEGMLLILYRSKIKSKLAEWGGIAIFALCIISFIFLFYDYYDKVLLGLNMADVNYTIVTAGTIGVMISYLIEIRKSYGDLFLFYDKGKLVTAYKYLACFNVWLYCNYIVSRSYEGLTRGTNVIGDADKLLLFVMITAVLAYILSKVSLLQDGGMRYVVIVMRTIVGGICVLMNLMPSLINEASKGVGITVLVIYNLLVLLNLRHTLKDLTEKENLNGEISPVLISSYVLFNTTLLLKMHLDLGYVDFMISIFYIITAFVLIIVGFKYYYRYIRYGGLVLAIFATAKLFLFDARDLWEKYRIVSYFAFGIVLIGISYMYQKFSRTMLLDKSDITIGGEE